MLRLIWIVLFSARSFCQNNFPSTPVEFRGLWCINQWNENEQNSTQQLGQAFFYNNGTFTMNFLNRIDYTWINHFLAIHKTDNQGTYHILTDTSRGPANYVNRTSCFWRRQISNGDILWGRQSNETCTPSFEMDNSTESIRYTRHAFNCHYIDDENSTVILSNTPFERELLQFDQSIKISPTQSIVFYGSSSIRLWPRLEQDFSNVSFNLIKRGYGGSTLKQCLEQFKRVILPLEPRLLILYAGENDLSEDQSPATIQAVFRQLMVTIRRFFPTLPVVFISIKPSPSRLNQLFQQNQTNHLIEKDIESMPNVNYLDIFHPMLTKDHQPRGELFQSDNLHMNEQGYAIWTRAIENYLQTNGYISNGSSSYELSILIIVFNLLVLFLYQNTPSIE